MRKRIGFAAIALATAGAIALSGCAQGSGEEAAPAGDTSAIITALGSEPQNPLIPANTNETGGGKIIDSIFAGLVYYTADGTPENDVAESIETDDAQTYTVKIKEGQKFSNGDPVDAAAFVDAWDWAALLSNAALNSYFFEDIEGFSWDEDSHLKGAGLNIVDDLTFTITLKSQLADFPLRLGYSAFYPMPAAAFDDLDAFGQAPIGNGPYMLDGDDAWVHNEKINLVTNPDYSGPRKPANGGVDFVFYGTQEAAYADLLSDNLDVTDAIPAGSLASFKSDLGDRAIDQASAVFQSITLPSDTANFANKDAYKHLVGEEGNLRKQAISMAINREEITDVIFEGLRVPAKDFTSPVISGYSEDIPGSEVLEFNPDEAKKLWAEADAISPWEGTFTIAYNADGGHQAWVDAVANQLKNTLGIDAAGAPYAVFKDIRTKVSKDDAGQRQITDSSWRSGWQADYPGLYNFLGPLYGTGAGSNDGDYSSEEFEALLKKGSASTSTDEANDYYQQAQEVLFKDLPAIPLWYSSTQGGYSTLVDNVAIDWHGVPLFYQITKGAAE